ncbi:MAG: translocation/assembly module TamB domain-containing protein [Candidatus Sulfotelmatobacter sp.]
MRARRIIGWTVAGLVALIVFAGGAGILFLRSHYFADYALRKIVDNINDATGGRAEIRNLDFDLFTLTAHLYDVTVHGSENSDRAPLLHVDKLTVGLKIQSVLRHKVTLSELLIEHPDVNLLVTRNGKSNLPQPRASQTSGNTSVFDLAVRHALLSRGEINYNDQQTPLDADLHDLNVDIHFNPRTTSYSGSIAYDDGHLRYAKYRPLPHDLAAAFNATPSGLSLDSAKLKVASSTLSLRATLVNYAQPVVDGSYDIGVHSQDFAAMSSSAVPAGDLSLHGNLHYQNSGNQSLLQSISIDGHIASDRLTAVSPDLRLELRKLQGKYRLAHGSLRADEIKAEVLGGILTASLDLQHLDATPSTNISALMHGISLRAVQEAARASRAAPLTVMGTVDGNVAVAWTGNIQNIRGHSDLTLRSAKAAAANTSQLPIDGEIHASYDGQSGALILRQTALHTATAQVSAQGEISKRSNLQIQASAGDLHQIVELASAFGSDASKLPGISGSASVNATVHGSASAPQVAGQLSAQNLQVQGSEWSSARLSFRADPSGVQIDQGSLVSAHQGKATFSGSAALRNWSYLPSNSIHANLSVQQMPVTDLQRLADLQYPVSGDLSADLNVTGSQLNPAGSGSAHIVNARAYDEPLQNLTAKFQASSGVVTSTLAVASAAGSVNADLSYTPQSKAYSFRINAPSVVLQKIHTLQAKNVPVTGTLALSAQGQGTLDRPQLTAVIESSQLQVKQNSISGLKAEVRVANQRADLSLSSQAAQSSIRAQGHVNLEGNYEAEGSIDTTAIPLDLLLATYTTVPEGFRGKTEFHATVKGPLKDKSQLEAHLTIPTFSASYQSLEIGAANPIRADYFHSVLTLQPATISGTGTSLRIEGTIPFSGNATPTLTANGTVDVRILRIVAPDVRSSGTLALDIRASGSAANPSLQGQVLLKDISLATDAAPLGLENLNGTLDIANDRIQVSSLAGQLGGGQLSAGGTIVFRPSVQFNLALQAKSIRLRYPDGLRTLLDGNLAFSGTTEASTLNGRVLIDSLSFTPDFDLAKFSDQFGGGSVPSQPGLADNVRLAIGVQSKDNLSATSSQISIEGNVNLQVIGTAANPVIVGRTDLTSGELFYRNVRYQLQHGLITFDNPTETEPKMDVAVTTTVEQYNLTLTLRGTLDKLDTSYTSDPPLATADVINLIARGQTTEESAASSQGTDSIVASQAASQVSGGLQKLAGISSLQIDPLIGGNNQNPSARIALQQRVTKNFLFTFSTDVTQPGTEIVEGDYQLNKRWSVSVARDETGGIAVDGRYHTKF